MQLASGNWYEKNLIKISINNSVMQFNNEIQKCNFTV